MLPLPAYATALSAGLDLAADLAAPLTIAPMQRTLVPTGIAIAVPEGFEAQVRMRSGTALKLGLALPNAPGTIDADYRGEVQVMIINLSGAPVTLSRGDRIAQLVIAPVARVRIAECEALPDTVRGAGGFGSTGK